MNRLIRVQMLIQCFMEKNEWTPAELMGPHKMECSRQTLYKIVETARCEYGMPLEYDDVKKVWRLAPDAENRSFPYIWFTPAEVLVLMTLLETFRELPFGIVDSELYPFKSRLETIIKSKEEDLGGILKNIKVLPSHFRRIAKKSLAAVCQALAEQKKIKISYKERQNDRVSERVVSPIQVVRYRDVWYLDAWCHTREALRIFSIDRISDMEILDEKAKRVKKEELKEFFAQSYGIFAGKPKGKVVLKFKPEIARWVASEEWHPDQEEKTEADGTYILTFPYSDERELAADIMKYGDGVEVVGPADLRKLVKQKLKAAAGQYK